MDTQQQINRLQRLLSRIERCQAEQNALYQEIAETGLHRFPNFCLEYGLTDAIDHIAYEIQRLEEGLSATRERSRDE